MAGNSARSSADAGAPGRYSGDAAVADDPLADLARLVADDRQDELPGLDDDGESAAARFEEDLALRGGIDPDLPDPAYPPEAYAGVAYDEADAHVPPDLRRRRGGIMLAAVVLAFAVVGGGGVYGYRLITHPHRVSGTPPVIRASTEPVKVAPKQTAEASNQNKLIYDRVTSDSPAAAHVVGGAEEPGERPVAVHDDGTRVVLPGQQTADAAPRTGAETASQGDSGIDARPVKTIAIPGDSNVALPGPPALQPDANVTLPNSPPAKAADAGSHIDAATQAQASAIMAAVADPKAPVTGTGVAAGLTLMPNERTGIMVGGDQPAASAGPKAPAAIAAPSSAPPEAGRPVPLPEARPAGLDSGGRGTRAAGRPMPLAPGTQAAAPRTAALSPPAAAAAPAAPAGGFMVQLSSQRSEADAQATFRKLQARYRQVLGQYQPVIAPAELGGRGTFYRVRVGAFSSREDANTVCEHLKAAGGSCIVQAN